MIPSPSLDITDQTSIPKHSLDPINKKMPVREGAILFALLVIWTTFYTQGQQTSSPSPFTPASASSSSSLSHPAQAGDKIPSAIVDLIQSDGEKYSFIEGVDFQSLLRSHKRAIVFAVPGAFTPTCSTKHLPGFIKRAHDLEKKGVEAIYCVSVNDKFVMRAWALATEGCLETPSLKLIADGNGDFTRAMHLVNDRTTTRMGIRSQRYAAVVENGVIQSLVVDDQGLDKTAAETVLGGISLRNTCSD